MTGPYPPLKQVDDCTLGSWKRFLEFEKGVWEEIKRDGVGYLARGQANEEWPLCSRLGRVLPPAWDGLRRTSFERIQLDEFQKLMDCGYSEFAPAPITEPLPWWDLMYQYGAPTRLLDWSTSLRTAAYFAAAERPECDGAIWLMTARIALDAHRDSRLEGHSLQHWCWFIDSPHLVVGRRPEVRTERMIAQASQYTFATNLECDHDGSFEEMFGAGTRDFSDDVFLRAIIPAEAKAAFLAELEKTGTSARTVFPPYLEPHPIFRHFARAATEAAGRLL